MDYYLTRVSSTELSEKIFKTECSIKNNARFSIENVLLCIARHFTRHQHIYVFNDTLLHIVDFFGY